MDVVDTHDNDRNFEQYSEDEDSKQTDDSLETTKMLQPNTKRQNGDGQETWDEDKEENVEPPILKKRTIAPPKLDMDFFTHGENDFEASSNAAKRLEDNGFESFHDKLQPLSPDSYSGSEPDLQLTECMDEATSPEDIFMNSDPYHDSLLEGEEWEWESQPASTPPMLVEPIPEYTAAEELEDERSWRVVQTADGQFRIDMKVIEPYKKVLSHGGYYGDGFNAIVVFTACHLPDRSRHDYHYVMDNLFLYVISTLELLVVDDYMLVFFHGGTPKSRMPGFRWLKRCYQMIDRRLRKNLKKLVIVHPTLWLRTVMTIARPLISSKFSAKLTYVNSLQKLNELIPTEYISVPNEIKAYDAHRVGNRASYSQTNSPVHL